MSSIKIDEEMRVAFERIRMATGITLTWFMISILTITGVLHYVERSSAVIAYATTSTIAIVVVLLSIGVQVEPLIKLLRESKNKSKDFWSQDINLKPKFRNRCLISEALMILGIILLIVSLLFVYV